VSVAAAIAGGPAGALIASAVAAGLTALLAAVREQPNLANGLRATLRRPLSFAVRAWQPLLVAGSFIAAARFLPDQVTADEIANEFHQQAAQVIPVLLVGLALEAGYFRVRGRSFFEAGGAMLPAVLLLVAAVLTFAELAKNEDGSVNIISGGMIAGTVALVLAALTREEPGGDAQTVAIEVRDGAVLNLEVNGSLIARSGGGSASDHGRQ
jgi:hypothetical protein